MVRVKVEFWTWSGSGKEWGPDFESQAGKHASLNLCVPDGTTVCVLFEDLERYPMVEKEVFDRSFRLEMVSRQRRHTFCTYDRLTPKVSAITCRVSISASNASIIRSRRS